MSQKHAVLAVLLAVVLVSGGVAASLGTVGNAAETQRNAQDAIGDAPGAVQDTQTVNNTSVTFENQTSNGSAVTVAEVNLTDGGFVVIHDRELLNGSVLDSVVGVSEYLEPGVHENVTVELNRTLNESQLLLAVAYRDTNDNQEYDFVESSGQNDSAYTVDNQVVVDDAFVTVDEEVTTTTTPEETTTTPEVTTTTPETTTPEETTTTETITTTTEETTTTTIETTTTPEVTTTTPETTTIETTTTTTTIETTTPEETTTTPEVTTTAPETTTTEEPEVEPPLEERQVSFTIDNVEVEEFSFVVGEGEVDRTVVVEDVSVADETVYVDITSLMLGNSLAESVGESAIATDADATASDLQTVQIILRDVTIQNVTFVVTAPEDVKPRLESRDVLGETTTAPEETTTVAETTTPEETTPEETTTTPEETTTEPAEEVDSLRVANLNAPRTLVLNEGQLLVNAMIENPTDRTLTETVELRVGGTVVAEERVEVEAGERTPVQFKVDRQTLDVEPGESFIEVLTRNYGQSIQVTVKEPGEGPAETTTTPEETTTTTEETTPEETTTEPTEETTTPAETTEEGEVGAETAGAASLRVSALDAPSSFVLDDGTLTVTAEVHNPTDEAVTDTVQLRVDGTLIEEQRVEVEPGETMEVQFEVDKQDLGLAPGEAFLEVLTRDFGESIVVTVEGESSERTTTTEG